MKRRDFLKVSKNGLLTSALLASFPVAIKAETKNTAPCFKTTLNNPARIEGYDVFLYMDPEIFTKAVSIIGLSSPYILKIKVTALVPEAGKQTDEAEITYTLKDVRESEVYGRYSMKFIFNKVESSNYTLQEIFKKSMENVEYNGTEKSFSVKDAQGKTVLYLLDEKIVNKPATYEDDWDCFLTTACVKYKNLNDEGPELTKLRFLRDNHILKTDEGKVLVATYYQTAPGILKKINSLDNKNDFYNHIYEQLVLPSLALIDTGKYEEATEYYSCYVDALKSIFIE